MDKDVLTRWLMTVGALALVVIVRRYFPESSDLVTSLGRDALAMGAGGLIGAAHVSKPGDAPKAEP